MKDQHNTYTSKESRQRRSPFFSVVIATYNRAHLIARALDSLIRQTEKDWEAIIVDDGSTDDTYSRIFPYIITYPNIRYVKEVHRGEANTKNKGVWSAAGRFVTFLDSDDEFERKHLESRKIKLMRNPSVKFLFGGVKIIGDPYVPDRFNVKQKIHLKDCVIGGTFFIERNEMISLKGFKDISLGTDADLFDSVKNANIEMMEVKQPTYIYHHETEDSITNKMNAALV